jgi:hypothetical protein
VALRAQPRLLELLSPAAAATLLLSPSVCGGHTQPDERTGNCHLPQAGAAARLGLFPLTGNDHLSPRHITIRLRTSQQPHPMPVLAMQPEAAPLPVVAAQSAAAPLPALAPSAAPTCLSRPCSQQPYPCLSLPRYQQLLPVLAPLCSCTPCLSQPRCQQPLPCLPSALLPAAAPLPVLAPVTRSRTTAGLGPCGLQPHCTSCSLACKSRPWH